MRGDDLQLGEPVQRPLENQMRQRDRRSQRVADCVRQPTVAAEALVHLGNALRMDEQGGTELLGPCPNRMQRRVGELDGIHPVADGGTAHTLLLHRDFQFLHRQLRVLQGQRRERREPVRLGGAEFGQFLVLNLDDLRRQIAVLVVPEGVDRQDLHVDRHGVHCLQAFLDHDEAFLRAADDVVQHGGVPAQQRGGFVEDAMRVHVDGLNGLAVHLNRPARRGRGGMRGARGAAAAKHNTGGRGEAGEKASA